LSGADPKHEIHSYPGRRGNRVSFCQSNFERHLREHNIELIVAKTRGFPVYDRVENELRAFLQNSSLTAVTTMFDYYGLPRSFPGRAEAKGNTPYEKLQFCEKALEEKINNKRFIAYLNLHEFEALLFSGLEAIDLEFPAYRKASELKDIRSKFASPEEINDSEQTAPSKRILKLFPNYQKDLNGINIASRIGLTKIRETCKHFDTWLQNWNNSHSLTNATQITSALLPVLYYST
jgi:hypothetical protein